MMKRLTAAAALVLIASGCALRAPLHTPPDYERAARAPLPSTPIGNVPLYDAPLPPAPAPGRRADVDPTPGSLHLCPHGTVFVPSTWKPGEEDPCLLRNRIQGF